MLQKDLQRKMRKYVYHHCYSGSEKIKTYNMRIQSRLVSVSCTFCKEVMLGNIHFKWINISPKRDFIQSQCSYEAAECSHSLDPGRFWHAGVWGGTSWTPAPLSQGGLESKPTSPTHALCPCRNGQRYYMSSVTCKPKSLHSHSWDVSYTPNLEGQFVN